MEVGMPLKLGPAGGSKTFMANSHSTECLENIFGDRFLDCLSKLSFCLSKSVH